MIRIGILCFEDMSFEWIVRKPVPLDWDDQAMLYGFKDGARHP